MHRFIGPRVMKGSCVTALALSAVAASAQSQSPIGDQTVSSHFISGDVIVNTSPNAGIYTRNGDNARSGSYQDAQITVASIKAKGLTLTTRIPVIGDARGMEAQPLIQNAVKMTDGWIRDVMVLPSLANVVRSVDAHSGAGLWQVTLGTPVTSSPKIDFHSINQHWGCLSTGVIVGTAVYLSCEVSIDSSGTPESGRYFLFALDLASGKQLFQAVPIQGADTSMWKQRAALTYVAELGAQGTIFIPHGSVYEVAGGYTGGITAVDVATHSVAAQLPMTSGIWMSGGGLVADSQNYLYAITANGDFNPSKNWWGESYIKMQYTPASGGVNGGHEAILTVVDNWTRFTDFARAGEKAPADKLAGVNMLTRELKPVGGSMSSILAGSRSVVNMDRNGQAVVLIYPPPMATGAYSDEDEGSAGLTLIQRYGLLVGGGKDGITASLHTSNLGHTLPADFANAKANCAKLAGALVWGVFSPGPVDPCPQDPRTLNFLPWGKTRHQHSTDVQWFDPDYGQLLFIGGENSPVQVWKIAPDGTKTYVANTDEYASSQVANSPGGMAGSMMALSSNNGAPGTAVLFAVQPFGDANATVTGGRLIAYDPNPADFVKRADGSLQMPAIWRSDQFGINFSMNKFMPPVIYDGAVYLPDYDGSVMEFTP